MELWKAYGSKSEALKAPKLEALKVRLILSKRHEIENEQAEAEEAARKKQEQEWEQMKARVHLK